MSKLETKEELLDEFIKIVKESGYSDYDGDAERLINETIYFYDNLPKSDKLSVEKLQEQLNIAKKALTEIAGGHTVEDAIFNHQLIASEALAAIGWDDD